RVVAVLVDRGTDDVAGLHRAGDDVVGRRGRAGDRGAVDELRVERGRLPGTHLDELRAGAVGRGARPLPWHVRRLELQRPGVWAQPVEGVPAVGIDGDRLHRT